MKVDLELKIVPVQLHRLLNEDGDIRKGQVVFIKNPATGLLKQLELDPEKHDRQKLNEGCLKDLVFINTDVSITLHKPDENVRHAVRKLADDWNESVDAA